MIELTKSEKRKLVYSMYLEGFSYKDIMKVSGYTLPSVSRILKDAEILNRQINYTESQIDQMIECWRDRLTPAQTGVKMGLTKHQVKTQLRRLDLID